MWGGMFELRFIFGPGLGKGLEGPEGEEGEGRSRKWEEGAS